MLRLRPCAAILTRSLWTIIGWAADVEIAESDPQGRPKREVIWLGDTPIAVLQ